MIGLRNVSRFSAIADDITSKYVPPHVNIFYCLGGITLTCFLVQVATGFAMTFYYRPTVTEAFSSVQYIMTEANFGWLIRSVHRWSASMMVLMMILHVFRVCGFGCINSIFWCNRLFLTLGPNWLLGSQDRNWCTRSHPTNRITFSGVITWKC
ncbi:hypothetical protein LUZ61_021474 [Rhynchospora tenuis]|uniref:Cytochrome b/b6 N-terminal region profile domain-containing protein n=1 Tax=Rhynchospora tenuis TaxID=198213 RepID=A0AAD5W7J0_9POAL|nr:hypothetical protein LUZ61_021474 [Rhynchospora tenuis]